VRKGKKTGGGARIGDNRPKKGEVNSKGRTGLIAGGKSAGSKSHEGGADLSREYFIKRGRKHRQRKSSGAVLGIGSGGGGRSVGGGESQNQKPWQTNNVKQWVVRESDRCVGEPLAGGEGLLERSHLRVGGCEGQEKGVKVLRGKKKNGRVRYAGPSGRQERLRKLGQTFVRISPRD